MAVAPFVLDVSSSGHLASTGVADDWTFFGRAGQAVTLVVSTGSLGSPAPLAPALNYAQVTLLDAGGNTLDTASNTQTGADVTLAGIGLPGDGTYHIRVQAPSAQSSSTGNYVITAYHATVQTAPLNFNQTITGTIDTPFRIDRWTFAAAAGQLIQFNLVNVANPAIVFDLTGPGGYTGFSGATASSGVMPLPTAGTYTLTVHSIQKQTGAYAFQLVESAPTTLVLGTPKSMPISGGGQAQFFQLNVAQAGQIRITLQDNAAADHNEIYATLGSVPTRRAYQYAFSTPASANQQLSIPTAAPGTYSILDYTESAPVPGSLTLTATEASVFLTAVTPDHSGTAADATLTLSGLGFDGTAAVSLVSSGGTAYPATTTNFDLPTQLTATFNAGTVPAGVYSVKVSLGSGASTTLSGAFTFVVGSQANLVTNLIVPNPIGLHIASTIYVEYSNTGTIAMPAPLLVLTGVQNGHEGALLTLDPALQVSGFWTSATPRGYGQSVQILASGATPGVLQPGEAVTVPVYYAGWLTSQWDLSRPPIYFNLGVLGADSTATVDWASMKSSLQPAGISENAWNGIYPNLTTHFGATWGSVIGRLDHDAAYLGSLGENVTDVSQLWSFEIQQANGIGVHTLASAVDMAAPSVGLPLAVARAFTSSIIGRNATGPFGNGWQLAGWGDSLTVQSDGTVVIATAGGAQRGFQPDSRSGSYFAQAGDHGTLASLGGGVYSLTTPTGLLTQFMNGHVVFVQETNGNRVTAGYTGGLLTSLTASSGQSITLAYNSAGRIIGLTNSLGQTAQYTYDPTSQYLLSAKDLDGYTTSYTYNAGTGPATNNALLSVTNPDGTQVQYSYDPQGRLTKVTLQGGAEAVQYAYGVGGTVTATNATGDTAAYFFDNRGLLAKTVDPLHRATFNTYDANGNLITATDPAGAVYSYAYDSLGNRIQATNPLGNTTRFSYGPLDTLSSVTDSNGNSTKYQYDQNGNLLSTLYADGTIESAAYNPVGKLMQSTDGNKNVIQYGYNAAGQLTSKTYADNSQTTYGHDALGNLTSVNDSTGTTNLSYDSANRLKPDVARTRTEHGQGLSAVTIMEGLR